MSSKEELPLDEVAAAACEAIVGEIRITAKPNQIGSLLQSLKNVRDIVVVDVMADEIRICSTLPLSDVRSRISGIMKRHRLDPNKNIKELNVKPTQINLLLETLEGAKNINVVIAFLARQVGRNVWDVRSASRLFNVLSGMRDIEDARKVLGIFKWLFEAGEKKRDNLRRLQPGTPAKKGFYYEFIKACL